jgi:hypothetical protein
MNDFTKEELETIRDDIKHEMSISALANHDFNRNMLNKVERMIDNYCEHKETVNIGGWVSKCVKCGTKFGDETQ